MLLQAFCAQSREVLLEAGPGSHLFLKPANHEPANYSLTSKELTGAKMLVMALALALAC
jgi:hypothetical protein